MSMACTVPRLTPCDYFLWGYVKDKVFVPPQPASIPDSKNRITAAVETITPDLLSRVWQELDYRLDVCRVTKCAHTEHLQACIKSCRFTLSFLLVFISIFTILVNIINFQTAPIILIHALHRVGKIFLSVKTYIMPCAISYRVVRLI